MSVYLVKMSRDMMHEFFKSFRYDPVMIAKSDTTLVYVYNIEHVDQLFSKHQEQGKLHFANMLNEVIIGDIYLKHIDPLEQSCEMGIHIANDKRKDKSYGTQAERILLAYAFNKLNMKAVCADTLIKK